LGDGGDLPGNSLELTVHLGELVHKLAGFVRVGIFDAGSGDGVRLKADAAAAASYPTLGQGLHAAGADGEFDAGQAFAGVAHAAVPVQVCLDPAALAGIFGLLLCEIDNCGPGFGQGTLGLGEQVPEHECVTVGDRIDRLAELGLLGSGLRRLKLATMRQLAPELLITAKTQRWAPEELLRTLIDAEITAREASNARTRMNTAAFPVIKTLDELDRSACSIPGPTLDYLASLEWITAGENLCLVGPAGTGKSHVLVALGINTVHAGRKVRYFTAADLAETLYRGLADNSVGQWSARSRRAR